MFEGQDMALSFTTQAIAQYSNTFPVAHLRLFPGVKQRPRSFEAPCFVCASVHSIVARCSQGIRKNSYSLASHLVGVLGSFSLAFTDDALTL